MRSGVARVCIVTSGHVGSAPRVVKEADALASAGNDVHVVAADITPGVRPLDEAVERRAKWRLHRVGRGGRVRWVTGRAVESLARVAWSLGMRGANLAEACESRLVAPLARAAAQLAPEIVVGHNLAGLAAAGRAAERAGCRLAFDAEDDHVGQWLPSAPARSRRVDAIQRRWIARAVVTTASSPLIAAYLESRYRAQPIVVLNCFARVAPLEAAQDAGATVRLYWISQTIGPGRGIEEAIAVLARLSRRWSLDLRGHVDDAYRAHLERLAANAGGALQFLPTIEPSQVTASARGYRLGISSELEIDANKQRCLGNKIFHYLAAGTPVWLSDTPAHRALAPELGIAGVLLPRDARAASERLSDWLCFTRDDPQALSLALSNATDRFDWKRQADALVAAYEHVLAGSS